MIVRQSLCTEWADFMQGLAFRGWRAFGGINSFTLSVGLWSLKWDPCWLVGTQRRVYQSESVLDRLFPWLTFQSTVVTRIVWLAKARSLRQVAMDQSNGFKTDSDGGLLFPGWGTSLSFFEACGNFLTCCLLAGWRWPTRPSAPWKQECDLNCSSKRMPVTGKE